MAPEPFLSGKGYCISSPTISPWVNRDMDEPVYYDPNGVPETKHEHDTRLKRENAARKAPERQLSGLRDFLDKSFDMICVGDRPKDHKFKIYDENILYDTAFQRLQTLYDMYSTPQKTLSKLQDAIKVWRKITNVHLLVEQLEHYMETQKIKKVTTPRKRKATKKNDALLAHNNPLPTPEVDIDGDIEPPTKKIKTEQT